MIPMPTRFVPTAPLLALCFAALAQTPASKPPGSLPGTFTSIPRSDIAKVQTAIQNGQPNDSPVRMVNIAGKFDLGVYTLNYVEPSKPRSAGNPLRGWYHNDIAEVYFFASGAGAWNVGGTLQNPEVDPVDGRSVKEVRGPGVIGVLQGYTVQKVSAGDILIVPPGIPHSPGDMTEPTKIIRFVLDPNKVLPLLPAVSLALAPTPRKTSTKPAPNLPGTFTFIPKADVAKVFQAIEQPGAYADQAVRTVDLANLNYRIGIYALHVAQMPKDTTPLTSGWYHTKIAEVYYFLNGAGVFTIGGSLQNPTADDPNSYATKMVRGPSVSGKFQGATNLKFEAGDVLIAPIGVPHAPSQVIAAPRDIIRIAIDPDKVLPLK